MSLVAGLGLHFLWSRVGMVPPSPGSKKQPFALDVEHLLGFDPGTNLLDWLPRMVFFLSNQC